jgi:DNA-binding transcriptional regulator YbjK
MNPEPPRRERKFSWPLAFTLFALIAAALLAWLFWRVESWPARTAQQTSAELERLARKTRDAFVEIAQLQPRVTVNNRVYLEKTTSVAELAIVSRQTEVEHEFEHSWAGSTKRVKLHGTFKVKAGFDLREGVSVDVRAEEIVVQVPHAKILGLEQEAVEVLELENGYWNRISAEDLQTELATLTKLARDKAAEANLVAEAESSLQQQLEQRIGSTPPVRITFGPKANVKP